MCLHLKFELETEIWAFLGVLNICLTEFSDDTMLKTWKLCKLALCDLQLSKKLFAGHQSIAPQRNLIQYTFLCAF